MKKWKVDYARRAGEEYIEGYLFVNAEWLDEAYYAGVSRLNERAMSEGWDGYFIWDVGVVADADEKML